MEDYNNPFTSDANTIALFHFDEASGDTEAVNEVSGANNADLVTGLTWERDPGLAWTTGQSGFSNAAYSYWNSGSDYCLGPMEAIEDSSELTIGNNDFTIEFWINPSEYANYTVILQKYTGADYDVRFLNGYIWFGWMSTGWASVTDTGTVIDTNTWTHVAILGDVDSDTAARVSRSILVDGLMETHLTTSTARSTSCEFPILSAITAILFRLLR